MDLTGKLAVVTGSAMNNAALWNDTQLTAGDPPLGIRVNALSFGATDTPMLRGFAPALADVAMRPEDVAQAGATCWPTAAADRRGRRSSSA